ncbi:hypothetical protein BABINDRAFT_163813 [Babjeviella inositovora NRRL Y-12698]|uniref:FAD synthase n=1 Tax=Babjeviella inositovora NRRL Y-12698 TaxID=984486 RepID=A0A1E3QJB3_9ASCO|nr:uncharacterized protein BABINDRAFT_163813 [Babjeviella inositovora NRRL Y-12698]ODQ77077.1 hypothetical protein BABINDRAFT_163813 [Babjeviella inositovora NRRL Y-12698]
MSFRSKCHRASEIVSKFLEPVSENMGTDQRELRTQTQQHVLETMKILRSTLAHYKLNEVAISYNGGKDCLVILVVLLAVMYDVYTEEIGCDNYRLDGIYVHSEESFEEVERFLVESCETWGLNRIKINDDLKSGFRDYMEHINPDVKAVVIGVRRTDPYSKNLTASEMTNNDWPRFMRINAALDWHYVHIWDFIRGCDLEYCKLYDLGYTSLGGVHTTTPNPYLRLESGSYNPAYVLQDDLKERAGRAKKNT